jgi:hypothetical protein
LNVSPESATAEKPLLGVLLEEIAGIFGLGEGRHVLELEFEDGHLRRWTSRTARRGRNELAEYDDQATKLLDRLRAES